MLTDYPRHPSNLIAEDFTQTDIGNVIRNATVFNFKNSVNKQVDESALLQAVDELFTLLDERQVSYVLVGGIAMLQYIDGRNTEDIDLIVAVADLKLLPEIVLSSENEYFARGQLGDLLIDFLLTRNALFNSVQQSHVAPQAFANRTIPCATVDGLLLLKLYALPSLYRQAEFDRVALYEGDITMLLQRTATPPDSFLKTLVQHLSATDIIELRTILDEIQTRIVRFQRGFQ